MSELYDEGANWYENELPAHEPVLAEPMLVVICTEPSRVPVIVFARAKLSEPVSRSVNVYVSPLAPFVPAAFVFEASLPESVQSAEVRPLSLSLLMLPAIVWSSVTVKLSSEVVVVSPIMITPESLTLWLLRVTSPQEIAWVSGSSYTEGGCLASPGAIATSASQQAGRRRRGRPAPVGHPDPARKAPARARVAASP